MAGQAVSVPGLERGRGPEKVVRPDELIVLGKAAFVNVESPLKVRRLPVAGAGRGRRKLL